jgi:hypothetical protein
MRKAAPFLLLAAFLVLLVPRMTQSMAQGDVYPEFSTLRSDPLGAKVLFLSLEALAAAPVARNYEPWRQLRPAAVRYVFLGASPLLLQDRKDLDKLLAGGGQVLVALRPPTGRAALRTEKLGFLQVTRTELELKGDAWRCLDGSRERCRLAAQDRLWLLADTSPLRNGDLHDARQTELLVRLFPPALPLVFDESHLGVVESGGVGVLLRRYRLFPAIAALLAAALLFVWRSSVPVLPERDPVSPDMTPQPAASLRTLLAQRVPERKLLETLVAEWKRALPLLPSWHRARVADVDAALEHARTRKNTREGYAQLQAAIRVRKGSQ